MAERHKQMYRYFKGMLPDDFSTIMGIIIHLGYCKIPRYRLMWNLKSLCYDPLFPVVIILKVSFLHIVDEATEKRFKDEGDKLAKVCPLNDHLQTKCSELYQPNQEISINECMVCSKA